MNLNQNTAMMVLAVDTTQPQLVLALAKGERLLAIKKDESSEPHTAKLFLCLDDLLNENAMSAADIDVIAVNTGPGSFTGLRVGLAAVMGLASTLQKKIIGINAIDAYALMVNQFGVEIVVLLNGARNEIFIGKRVLATDNGLQVLGVDESVSENAVLDELGENADRGNIIFIGSGAVAHWEALKQFNEQWQLVEAEKELVSVIATSAVNLLEAQKGNNSLQAYYVRASEAELKLS